MLDYLELRLYQDSQRLGLRSEQLRLSVQSSVACLCSSAKEVSLIWILSSIDCDVFDCSTEKANLRGIILNVACSHLHGLNLLQHGFFSYITVQVSTYTYLSDMFVSRCQPALMINVYVWKESCLVAIWRKGNGNAGMMSPPFRVINPGGISPIFRSISLVLIVTNLNTSLQCFTKNREMHWREKEPSSFYSLFSAWSMILLIFWSCSYVIPSLVKHK